MPLAAGQRLGRYQILGSLGSGAMGEVYRAADSQLERHVAVKVLPIELAADPERLARFEREAKVLARLQHPGIVTVHSVEEAEGLHFLTMELVQGTSLAASKEHGRIPLERFYVLGSAIADAVHAAHKSGVTHRDLKPANVMLDAAGRPTVLDFGLAKVAPRDGAEAAAAPSDQELTDAGRLLGTIPYMAPEALRGEPADSRSDVYSLGVLLFEVLTGRHPFTRCDPGETMAAILAEPAPDADELRRDVPRPLARLLGRCLVKDPERRLQTALDLRNELEEIARSEPEPTAALRAGAGWRSALPGVVAGAALALAGTWAAQHWDTDESPRVLTMIPVTSIGSYDLDPAWSPDGGSMAFSRMTDGSLDLYVRPVVGVAAIRRTTGPGDAVSPAWSPDGKYIAYLSTEQPGTPLMSIPAHSGEPRQLTETSIAAFDVSVQRQALGERPWSRDSASLLVARRDATGRLAIFRVSSNERREEQLSYPGPDEEDLSASFSWDYETIVFTRRFAGRGALMMMPAAGGEPRELLRDARSNQMPAFRPDDRRVLYESNPGTGVDDLWEIDVRTRIKRQLSIGSKDSQGFGVSRDDRILAAQIEHDTFLTVLDLATGESARVTRHAGSSNFGPRFSPDGQSIAYHSNRTGDSEVWVSHLDGRHERRITDVSGSDAFPDWSPDGQHLTFVSSRDGAPRIYVTDRNGGDCHVIGERPVTAVNVIGGDRSRSARWSPSGDSIGFIVSGPAGSDLWAARVDGQDGPTRLVEGVAGFDWYLDDRRAICTRADGRDEEIFAVDLEAGTQVPLWRGPHAELDVSPDGRTILLCSGRGHHSMGLARLTLEPPASEHGLPTCSSAPVMVVQPSGTWHVHHGGWSADGQLVVYVHDQDRGDIYELVENE